MKAMSKLWMALVVGVMATAVAIPSWAAPTRVSMDTYMEWIDKEYGRGTIPRPFREFAFRPPVGTPPYDGEVLSTVYYGKGPAEGLYVYVYQVIHYSSSSELEIDNIRFHFFGPILTNPSRQHDARLPRTFAFQVSGTGDRQLIDASISTRLRRVAFSFGGIGSQDGLTPGQSSWLFGFFSKIPPTITVATVTDTYREASPLVYTTSPEPSVGVMFGLGLLGLPFFRALRRRFMK